MHQRNVGLRDVFSPTASGDYLITRHRINLESVKIFEGTHDVHWLIN